MSGLYPDESYCTSEIGALLFKPKSDWTGTSRVVDIATVKGIAGTHNNYIIEFKVCLSYHPIRKKVPARSSTTY